jgi:hydroxylysine kinase
MDDVTLLTAADAVRPRHVADVLRAEYGLAGDLDRLPGEADDNFLLRAPAGRAGRRYVVKFAHPLTDPEVIDTQARVLRQLQSRTKLPVQHVISTRDGRLWTKPADRIVLVTTYLTGTPMRQAAMTQPVRRHLGVILAVLARALKDIPARPRRLLWDIAQLPSLRPLAAELPPDHGRDQLTALVDRFQERTGPRLAALRTQLVHNDFNVDNILIDDGAVSGILDFGDMTVTALANDVAIAACYHLGQDGEDLIEPALDLIAGYHATTPLTAGELDLLPDLILARMTARVIIPRWRAVRFPDNQEYILRSAAMATAHLNRLLEVPDGQFAERIHARA